MDQAARQAQGVDQAQGLRALRGGKINIARTHGQAVGFANDRHPDDFHRQVEIVGHASNHRQLLEILAPEKRQMRLDNGEQLGHHRGHATKVPRPAAPAKGIGQPFDIDIGGVPKGVHLPRFRGENQIDAGGFGESRVPAQIAGIGFEILPLPELGRVDEDRQHQQIASLAPLVEQRTMAVVQITHCRHEGDAPSRLALGQATLLHPVDVGDYFHLKTSD